MVLFDNVVIPLATKMYDSKVLHNVGVALLDFAKKNRDQWQEEGKEKVEVMEFESKGRLEAMKKKKSNNDTAKQQQGVVGGCGSDVIDMHGTASTTLISS